MVLDCSVVFFFVSIGVVFISLFGYNLFYFCCDVDVVLYWVKCVGCNCVVVVMDGGVFVV